MPFSRKPEHAAGLGLGRNLDRDVAVERRHVERAAERGGLEGDRHFAGKVAAVTLEDVVLAYADLDVEVAGRSAVATRLAFAGQADPVAGVDARRHFDRQRLLLAAYDPARGIYRKGR